MWLWRANGYMANGMRCHMRSQVVVVVVGSAAGRSPSAHLLLSESRGVSLFVAVQYGAVRYSTRGEHRQTPPAQQHGPSREGDLAWGGLAWGTQVAWHCYSYCTGMLVWLSGMSSGCLASPEAQSNP